MQVTIAGPNPSMGLLTRQIYSVFKNYFFILKEKKKIDATRWHELLAW